MHDTVLSLEKSTSLYSDVYFILHNLRTKIQQRIEDKFFGFMGNNFLKGFATVKQEKVTTDFLKFDANLLYRE